MSGRRRSGDTGRDGDWWPTAAPRLPGPGPRRASGRAAFGKTWWGAAWVEALEQRARLDPNRLPRGRTYARTGAVGPIEVLAGEVLAQVQGSRSTPYAVRVRVRPFSGEEWDRILDALAAEIGHTAALLEGELPPEVADDVRSTGLDLLPGAGEVQPRCSCPDWADPCKHAAAVCYLVADLLDEDPFVVFSLRGRSREELLANLRTRRHRGLGVGPGDSSRALAGDEPGWSEDEGVPARDAWARTGPEAPGAAALPRLPLPPRRPGRPTVLALDPPPQLGLDPGALQLLAADAAARGWALAVGDRSAALEQTADEDLARRVAALLGTAGPGPGGHASTAAGGAVTVRSPSPDLARIGTLARRSGLPARALLRRGLAWRYGGAAGLAALVESWDLSPGEIATGKALLGTGARARRNRVTLGSTQLRAGRDGRWYPYRRSNDGGWDPDGPPLAGGGADGDGASAGDGGAGDSDSDGEQ